MKLRNFAIICMVLCLSVVTGCRKDNDPEKYPEHPELNETTKRTVLMYLFQDTNLVDWLTDNINELELGWDPDIDGTMLVYVDASTRMTQFDGKPVLLEITHDKSNIIVSKVVKVYEDADATDTDVFIQAQEDAIAMYPAESYGLIIAGHGDGFFVSKNTKAVGNSERWGTKYLDIDVIAENVPVYYDFIIFDACLIGETATLYQLRDVTDFVVASAELSPGDGFAYRSDINALFAQPNADLFTFTRATSYYYQNDPIGIRSIDGGGYTTIGVYRMSAMEKLAAVTKEVVTKLNLRYNNLRAEIHNVMKNPSLNILNSMYYPRDIKRNVANELHLSEVLYYDMGLLSLLLEDYGYTDLINKLNKAIYDVVIQSHFAFSQQFPETDDGYKRYAANLSFFIPGTPVPNAKYQNEAFYNRFEWSSASGFTNKWE